MLGKNILHYKITEKSGEGGMSQNFVQIVYDQRIVIMRIPMRKTKSGGM